MNPPAAFEKPRYPIQLDLGTPKPAVRFWAIPLIGILAKLIIAIPHLIILYVLAIVVEVLQLVLWIPVLFGGEYPAFGRQIVGGYLRWSVRVQAFLYGLTDQYPPFQLGE